MASMPAPSRAATRPPARYRTRRDLLITQTAAAAAPYRERGAVAGSARERHARSHRGGPERSPAQLEPEGDARDVRRGVEQLLHDHQRQHGQHVVEHDAGCQGGQQAERGGTGSKRAHALSEPERVERGAQVELVDPLGGPGREDVVAGAQILVQDDEVELADVGL